MVSSKKKWTVMNPIRRQMKKRNPSSGQNGQLVHWWLLIHSGRDRRGKEPEWEMCRTGRGGIDRLKNRSGKCEGPGGGIDGVKNRSGKCEGPGRGGGVTNGCLKRKVFFKNQKHQPNIVEITHLCICTGFTLV